jgi:pimeloyl-ACP methyl ester carboxylesterase
VTVPEVERFDAVLPHGITLSCRAAGPRDGAPRVLLLHGFPEAAFIWDEVMRRLAPSVRCVAPNLRGYERSSAPPERAAYRARHLLADIAALIERGGAPIDLLVGHDWGGALAWVLAAQRPQLLKRLLIVNAPHPAAFLRELRDSPAQQQASAYMNFLCRDDAARLLRENDFARLYRLLTAMAPAPWLDDAMRARYRDAWQHGLEGPLNYYRASPLRPPASPDDPIHTLSLEPEAVTVHVPTTVLWGDADRALLPSLLDGLDAYVADLEVQRIPDATHWLIHEQPARVTATIERLLAAPP